MSGSNSSAPGSAPEPVSFTVHSVPRPGGGPDTERRTRRGRLGLLLVFAICLAPVIASYLTYFVIRPQGRTNYSELVNPPRSLPDDLPLRSLAGASVPAQSLKGQWLLVVVSDAACDARCEKQLFLQRQLREMLGQERDRLDKLWLVADDAAPRAAVVTAVMQGQAAQVLTVPKAALAVWLQPAAGEQLSQHLYIVDPLGRWMMRTPVDPDPARLKKDLEKLLRASASWDRPGR